MQVAGLNQYQSHNVPGSLVGSGSARPNATGGNPAGAGFPLPAGADTTAEASAFVNGAKLASLGLSPTTQVLSPGRVQTQQPTKVSGAGDTLQLSQTSSARAQVQTANSHSQTIQAALTTAKAVDAALARPAQILQQMQQIVGQLAGEQTGATQPQTQTSSQTQPQAQAPAQTAAERQSLAQRFDMLAQSLDRSAQAQTFAGHKLLDGNFRATFRLGDDQRVTIDATLPNGKDFSLSGLNLEGGAQAVRTLAQAPTSLAAAQARRELPAYAQNLQVAHGAVTQVRQGVSAAAGTLVEALTGPAAPLGAVTAPSAQVAGQLLQNATASLLGASPLAMFSQANTAATSALRLLS